MTTKMLPDDPRHGTPAQPMSVTVNSCRCESCEDRRRVRQRKDKLRDMGRPRMVTPARTQAHLKRLVAAGWTTESVAQAASIGIATLSEIRRGIPGKIMTVTEAAVLAVAGPPAGFSVPSEPTRRRLRPKYWLSCYHCRARHLRRAHARRTK